MTRMTKAQARKRIKEAQKKLALVYVHYSSTIGISSTKDLEAINQITTKWQSKLK
jgi:predicted adenine nucleotide alpha hydrolase (AANH) superfamily ATPase